MNFLYLIFKKGYINHRLTNTTVSANTTVRANTTVGANTTVSANTTVRANKMKRGAGCSISGRNYELNVHSIVSQCKFEGRPFNNQSPDELGGSSSKQDIICSGKDNQNIAIEIKKANTPDWMQCSLKYDSKNNKWIGSPKCKIPIKSRELFEELINNIKLFDGEIPPFVLTDENNVNQKLTYDEWLRIKNGGKFKDAYFDCPDDTIARLYNLKGCAYIQISNKGLYSTGNDICEFNAPLFKCEQQIRIRIKVHTRSDKNNYCKLSIMAACKPKNIKALDDSSVSLDNKDKLPKNLIFECSKFQNNDLR